MCGSFLWVFMGFRAKSVRVGFPRGSESIIKKQKATMFGGFLWLKIAISIKRGLLILLLDPPSITQVWRIGMDELKAPAASKSVEKIFSIN